MFKDVSVTLATNWHGRHSTPKLDLNLWVYISEKHGRRREHCVQSVRITPSSSKVISLFPRFLICKVRSSPDPFWSPADNDHSSLNFNFTYCRHFDLKKAQRRQSISR